MTPAAALALAEAALRRGMCPPARHADKGCHVCDDTLAAIEALRSRFKPTEAERRWADASASLARNGVWGTCVDCPDAEGRVYGQHRGPTLPERCPNFARYDHRLTAEKLERSIATERWNYECDEAIPAVLDPRDRAGARPEATMTRRALFMLRTGNHHWLRYDPGGPEDGPSLVAAHFDTATTFASLTEAQGARLDCGATDADIIEFRQVTP